MRAWIFRKYYTRVIGIAFLLIALSLVFDYLQLGYRAETRHKVFHMSRTMFLSTPNSCEEF